MKKKREERNLARISIRSCFLSRILQQTTISLTAQTPTTATDGCYKISLLFFLKCYVEAIVNFVFDNVSLVSAFLEKPLRLNHTRGIVVVMVC